MKKATESYIEKISFDTSLLIIKEIIQIIGKMDFLFKGSSMLPTIQPESILTVKKVDSLKIDNIYIYIDENSPTNRLVCHRLKKIGYDGYCIFKGDNRKVFDEPVKMNCIIGVVFL